MVASCWPRWGWRPFRVKNGKGFLAAFASAAEPVELNFLRRPQLKNPVDELMLEATVNARAAAIVTHNVSDFRSATERFGVATMTPAEFLKELPNEQEHIH
jgi:hypothetical protein